MSGTGKGGAAAEGGWGVSNVVKVLVHGVGQEKGWGRCL